jgi:hypothetical protein
MDRQPHNMASTPPTAHNAADNTHAPSSCGGELWWMWKRRRERSQDAPCRLNTPTTPPTLFMFHTCRGGAVGGGVGERGRLLGGN